MHVPRIRIVFIQDPDQDFAYALKDSPWMLWVTVETSMNVPKWTMILICVATILSVLILLDPMSVYALLASREMVVRMDVPEFVSSLVKCILMRVAPNVPLIIYWSNLLPLVSQSVSQTWITLWLICLDDCCLLHPDVQHQVSSTRGDVNQGGNVWGVVRRRGAKKNKGGFVFSINLSIHCG